MRHGLLIGLEVKAPEGVSSDHQQRQAFTAGVVGHFCPIAAGSARRRAQGDRKQHRARRRSHADLRGPEGAAMNKDALIVGYPQQPYTAAVKLIMELFPQRFGPHTKDVAIPHDEWCPVYQGGVCSCNFEIAVDGVLLWKDGAPVGSKVAGNG